MYVIFTEQLARDRLAGREPAGAGPSGGRGPAPVRCRSPLSQSAGPGQLKRYSIVAKLSTANT